MLNLRNSQFQGVLPEVILCKAARQPQTVGTQQTTEIYVPIRFSATLVRICVVQTLWRTAMQ